MSAQAAPALPVRTDRLPPWIRVRPPIGPRYDGVRSAVAQLKLGTVCREARCPNLPECWSSGTATLMLLGTDCSRRCGFCAVRTHWANGVVDLGEPERVAEGVSRWGLRYVVLTQVCRDDLSDGGASVLAETVGRIRERAPGTLVELLVGDLGGGEEALHTVLEARPDVLGHNLETVESLSPSVRDRRAGYRTSLTLLRRAKAPADAPVTKSSLMLGLGESDAEIDQALRDLRASGVELLTLGQYLRPSPRHLPVARYVTPDQFEGYRTRALDMGFAGVEAGPLARSSYHAQELYEVAIERRGA